MVHVASILLYQYTGHVEVMALSALMLGISFLIYVVGVASLISPEVAIEIDDEEYERQSDYGGRGVLQTVVLIIAYIAWQNNYDFIAGILTVQAVTILASCIVSLFVKELVNMEEEDDEK